MLETPLSRMLYRQQDSLLCMKTLAERVKEAVDAAKNNGYSKAQIAQVCGISDKAVYQWINGSTKSIDGKNLVELAAISGYHARWIANEIGPKSDTKAVTQALELLRKMTPENQAIAVKIIAPLVEQNQDEHGGDMMSGPKLLPKSLGQPKH